MKEILIVRYQSRRGSIFLYQRVSAIGMKPNQTINKPDAVPGGMNA